MSLNTNSTKKTKYPRVGEGSFPSRVVGIVDLGMQLQTDWQTGEDREWDDGSPMLKPEVFIQFELPTETIEVDGEDKPRWLSKTYILSNHEKAALTGLMGATGVTDGDVTKVLDKPLQVSVGSTKTGNDKITGVVAMMKGVEVAPLINNPFVFDLDNPDMVVHDKLPPFIKEKLVGKIPAVGADSPEPQTPDGDDPF